MGPTRRLYERYRLSACRCLRAVSTVSLQLQLQFWFCASRRGRGARSQLSGDCLRRLETVQRCPARWEDRLTGGRGAASRGGTDPPPRLRRYTPSRVRGLGSAPSCVSALASCVWRVKADLKSHGTTTNKNKTTSTLPPYAVRPQTRAHNHTHMSHVTSRVLAVARGRVSSRLQAPCAWLLRQGGGERPQIKTPSRLPPKIGRPQAQHAGRASGLVGAPTAVHGSLQSAPPLSTRRPPLPCSSSPPPTSMLLPHRLNEVRGEERVSARASSNKARERRGGLGG